MWLSLIFPDCQEGNYPIKNDEFGNSTLENENYSIVTMNLFQEVLQKNI